MDLMILRVGLALFSKEVSYGMYYLFLFESMD